MKNSLIIVLVGTLLATMPGCLLWSQYDYDDLDLHGKVGRTADLAATPVVAAVDLAAAPILLPMAYLGTKEETYGRDLAPLAVLAPGLLVEVVAYNATAAAAYPLHVVFEDLPDALIPDPKDPEKLTRHFLRRGEHATKEYYDRLIKITGRRFAPSYRDERHDYANTPAIAGLGVKGVTLRDAEYVCGEWRAWLESGMPTGSPDELTFVLKWMNDSDFNDEGWWLDHLADNYKFREETVAALVAALTYDNYWVRSHAVQKLACVRNHDVSEPLRFALKDESASVRAATIRIIPQMVNDTKAIELLIIALGEPEDSLQYDVLKSFDHYGGAVLEPLLASLPKLAPRARGLGYRVVSRIDDPRAEEAVFDGLNEEEVEALRGAVSALKVYADQVRAQEQLLILLKDDDAEIRKTAIEGLGAAREPDTVPALVRALDDSNAGVCRTAAEILGRMKAEAAIEPLIKLMNHDNNYVAGEAAGALRNIGGPAVNALVKVWGGQPVQAKVIILRRIFGSDIHQLALDGLKDEAAEVRKAAAYRLGGYSKRSVPDPLIPLLQDEDPEVRRAAAHGLRNSSDPEAAAPLIKSLSDDNAEVRAQAALALGYLREGSAFEPVLSLLADSSAEVRSAAAEGLGRLADPKAIKPLKKLLRDEDETESVKKSAKWAIETIYGYMRLRSRS